MGSCKNSARETRDSSRGKRDTLQSRNSSSNAVPAGVKSVEVSQEKH